MSAWSFAAGRVITGLTAGAFPTLAAIVVDTSQDTAIEATDGEVHPFPADTVTMKDTMCLKGKTEDIAMDMHSDQDSAVSAGVVPGHIVQQKGTQDEATHCAQCPMP